MFRPIFPAIFMLSCAAAPALAGGWTAPVTQAAPPAMTTTTGSVWSGAYVGASLGKAFDGEDRLGLRRTGQPLRNAGTFQLGGANIGLHAGYMANLGGMIGAAELGLTFGDISSEVTMTGTSAGTAESKMKHAVTLRGKLGSEVAPGTLVYGIGGVSYGAFSYSVPDNGATASADYDRVGFVVGLGVERRLSERLSVTGAYEFADYGKEKLKLGDTETRATPKFHNLSVGLNYRF